MTSEASLVDACRSAAAKMNAFLAETGQRRAKGSGTTTGYPDLTLICAGEIVLIEVKRPATADHPRGYVSLGQQAFIERAAEQGVTVHVIDRVDDFIRLVNWCRRDRTRHDAP